MVPHLLFSLGARRLIIFLLQSSSFRGAPFQLIFFIFFAHLLIHFFINTFFLLLDILQSELPHSDLLQVTFTCR